jgi:pimeloyl-ACP methyl ester carboxylesterase
MAFYRSILGSLALATILTQESSALAAPQACTQKTPEATTGRFIPVRYKFVEVDGHKIFYREAGAASAPNVLLLHGFPSSSHMYRNLIPLLADRYHVVAPDLPGFGFSDAPARTEFKYTFDNLARIVDTFTQTIGLKTYAIQVFDYGAPVGFRLAMAHPERITAIVTQNGNAYEEGLGSDWDPIRKYWRDPTAANREALRSFLTADAVKQYQYMHGAADSTRVAPDAYMMDAAFLARPGNQEIQLDLFLDYASNVALYGKFQEYLRKHHPPLLAVWGKNDPLFIPPGAQAFKKDDPNAEVHLYDAGHFALETDLEEIGPQIRRFLARSIPASRPE